jgi:hypothetical protein
MPLNLLADTWSMHDGDVGVGWMIVMMLGMAVFWAAVILGILWVVRDRRHDDPVAILDRRLAEGRLSTEEYEQRRKLLQG